MRKKMRRPLALLCAAAGVLSPAAVRAQSPLLQEGVERLYSVAEAHNASLRRVRAAVSEAGAGVETAKNAMLPEISGQASFSYLGNARLWNRKFGEGVTAAMPHYGNNFLLRAEQALYAGGAIKGGIALARQEAEMQRLTAEDERQRVRYTLVTLYLRLHSLRNQSEVYAANAALAAAQIELMRRRRESGVSLRNDITRYELQLRQTQLGKTTMDDQADIALRQLLTAVGTDSAEVDTLPAAAFDEAALPSAGDEAEWENLAAESHKGVQRAALAVDMGLTRETLARAERRPKVVLVAEDHLDGPITIEVPPINKNLNYWYVGVGVSYNFSSLYKGKRKLRQARLGTALARETLDETRQGVGDAVHAAFVNLRTARTELATREKSVELATENYRVVSKRYESGLALVTDLTDAADMKLDAELALANARVNLAHCYYTLKYATHTL